MEKIILIGCGGHAKSIVDVIENSKKYEIVGFVNDFDFEYRDYHVVGNDDDLQLIYDGGIKKAFICIGYIGEGKIRQSLYNYVKKIGFTIPNIIDNTAIVASDVRINEGVFIGKRAIINSNSEIKKMAIINSGAIVEHDSLIYDFTHVAVGAVICGNVTVYENCLVGANSTIIQGITISRNVKIGAGSIVLSSVSSDRTVVGVFK